MGHAPEPFSSRNPWFSRQFAGYLHLRWRVVRAETHGPPEVGEAPARTPNKNRDEKEEEPRLQHGIEVDTVLDATVSVVPRKNVGRENFPCPGTEAEMSPDVVGEDPFGGFMRDRPVEKLSEKEDLQHDRDHEKCGYERGLIMRSQSLAIFRIDAQIKRHRHPRTPS